MQVIAFDEETFLIQPGRVAPKMVCLTWFDGKNSGIFVRFGDGRRQAIEWMRARLLDDDVILAGAQVAFDLAVMANEDITLLPLIFCAYDMDRIVDVQIDEMLRNIALGRHGFDPTMGERGGKPRYTLAELSGKYLNENMGGKSGEDAWRFRYFELRDTPLDQWPQEAIDYALDDAIKTHRVHACQKREKRGGFETMPCFFQSCREAWGLYLKGGWGLRSDESAVIEFERHLHLLLDDLLKDLTAKGFYRWGGTKKEPKLSKDTKVIKVRAAAAYDLLIEEHEEKQWPLTPKGIEKLQAGMAVEVGDISISGDALRESCDADLELIAEASDYQKLLSTFGKTLRKGVLLPINPRWNVLVESYRTSCSKPNAQQMPRKGGVRECYVPREGWIFAGCDYDTAELRSLAQVLLDAYGQSAMAESLLAGRQLHLELAADILELDYDETVRLHKAGDKEVKEARQLSKAANFGYPGGLGPVKFQAYARKGYGVELTLDESKKLKKQWKCRFPEMDPYHRDIGAALEEQGGRMNIVTPRTHFVRGGTRYCDSCNHFFQNLTASGAKAADYEVSRECYLGITRTGAPSPLFNCRPVLFVHDEIIVEVPLSRIGWDATRAAAKRLGEIMVEQMRRFTPDIPCIAEPHLMRRWYKDADPVKENGVLVPWQPKDPRKVLQKALADAGKTEADLAALGMDLNQPWRITFEIAQGLVQLFGKKKGDVLSWLSVQRLWDLENAAQVRETQALSSDWEKYVQMHTELEADDESSGGDE